MKLSIIKLDADIDREYFIHLDEVLFVRAGTKTDRIAAIVKKALKEVEADYDEDGNLRGKAVI